MATTLQRKTDASHEQTAQAYVLTTADMELDDFTSIVLGHRKLALAPDVREVIAASRKIVDDALDKPEPVYGLNTGLGHRRNERVSNELLLAYQPYIVRTHAGSVGEALSEATSRAAMVARIVGLSRGGAGIRETTLDALIAMLNTGVHPKIPEFGSVGASDLCAMSAIAEVVIGEGEASYQGEMVWGRDALAKAGLEPVILQAKEGLGLVNANGLSIGAGIMALWRAKRVLKLANLAVALSLDAYDGNPSPFDARIQAAKAFPEQVEIAATIRALLQGSDIWEPSTTQALQDPLSFRTVPQVHGAVARQIKFADEALQIELNNRSDNPLVDVESGGLISGGNSQAPAPALAMDALRIGLCHIAILAERRCTHVFRRLQASTSVDAAVQNQAVQNMRLVFFSAADLMSRIKANAAPASIHAPSVGHDVEDHGSLGPAVAAATERTLELLEYLLSVEILISVAAVSGMERSEKLGQGTKKAFDLAYAAAVQRDDFAHVTASRQLSAIRALIPQLLSTVFK